MPKLGPGQRCNLCGFALSLPLPAWSPTSLPACSHPRGFGSFKATRDSQASNHFTNFKKKKERKDKRKKEKKAKHTNKHTNKNPHTASVSAGAKRIDAQTVSLRQGCLSLLRDPGQRLEFVYEPWAGARALPLLGTPGCWRAESPGPSRVWCLGVGASIDSRPLTWEGHH